MLFALFLLADVDLKKQMGDELFAAAGLTKLSAKELAILQKYLSLKRDTPAQPGPQTGGKLADLLGGVIVAQDGRVLGRISKDPMDPDSLANDTSPFARRFGPHSLLSKLSPYGDGMSDTSAFNPAAKAPPKVFLGDKFMCYLTMNHAINPRVDTKQLLLFIGVAP